MNSPILSPLVRLQRLVRPLGGSRPLLVGGLILAFVLAAALLANWLYPRDPLDIVAAANLWPGAPGHFLGTDMMGRDMASGLVHSAGVSLAVGFFAALLSVTIGIAVGLVAGYCGGWADEALMRGTEMFQTLPSFLFAIVLVVILTPSIASIIFAIGITAWPQIARLVRAEAMRVRNADYVTAARTIGLPGGRILLRHVLPNSLAPVVVATSVLMANAILTEASLSFLGLGDPGVISWGSMIGMGRSTLRTAWYMTALPGAAIFVTVISFMLLGNGLNDYFNPRLKQGND
ncbi:ABC transporter permease [Herbaspirillum sp. YR522]|uniref:ABC transporter permease n=1 Tax=Herbaspirillum sp. YR522 TaxID=1144342 RepID=UPI00026F909A|nr:ABC transporter permease [Herbaspirillum sp. YR522]EJN09830.1 ABC-type dipeptide/oligopeptide/nickel transport system, permease component [Herbaspirillum sp. YR522]